MINKAISLSLISTLQLILSLALQLYILKYYSLGSMLDIYFISNIITTLCFTILTSSINSALTPYFTQLWEAKKYKEFKETLSSLVNILFILFIVIIILLLITSKFAIGKIFTNYSKEQIELLLGLFNVFTVMLILAPISSVFNAVNFSKGKFNITQYPSIIAIILNLTAIHFTIDELGLYSLALGFFISEFIKACFAINSNWKDYRLIIVVNKAFYDLINKVLPTMYSSIFSKSDLLASRYYSSMATPGLLSSFHYSKLIIDIKINIISKGISIVSLRMFSTMKDQQLKDKLIPIINTLFTLSFVIMTIAIINFDFIFNIIVNRYLGFKLDIVNLKVIYFSLFGYLLFGILLSVLVNIYYSRGFTKLVAKTNIVCQVISLTIIIFYYQTMGFIIIPIAMSLKSASVFLILFFRLRIVIGEIRYTSIMACAFFNILNSCVFFALSRHSLDNIIISLIYIFVTSSIFFISKMSINNGSIHQKGR